MTVAEIIYCTECGTAGYTFRGRCEHCGKEFVRRRCPSCPQCGKPIDEEDNFCSWCGAGLKGVQQVRPVYCLTCGARLHEDMQFCAQCGQRVVAAQRGDAPDDPANTIYGMPRIPESPALYASPGFFR